MEYLPFSAWLGVGGWVARILADLTRFGLTRACCCQAGCSCVWLWSDCSLALPPGFVVLHAVLSFRSTSYYYPLSYIRDFSCSFFRPCYRWPVSREPRRWNWYIVFPKFHALRSLREFCLNFELFLLVISDIFVSPRFSRQILVWLPLVSLQGSCVIRKCNYRYYNYTVNYSVIVIQLKIGSNYRSVLQCFCL